MNLRYINLYTSSSLTTLYMLYVPVTVHREQSVRKENQQDATI